MRQGRLPLHGGGRAAVSTYTAERPDEDSRPRTVVDVSPAWLKRGPLEQGYEFSDGQAELKGVFLARCSRPAQLPLPTYAGQAVGRHLDLHGRRGHHGLAAGHQAPALI